MTRRLTSVLMAAVLAVPGVGLAQDTPAPEKPARAASKVVVDEQTAKVIDGAMKYLATKQSPGGGWSANGNNHQAAVTAYVVNAYLAAGHLPGEGPYGKEVQRGVDFILDCVRPDGYIAAPTGEHNMYGHGIACIVLGEVYGMTQDQRLRPALERAIRLIVECQNDQGGWRYQPRKSDADISVTVLQVTALRVAKNSGIDVPQKTIDRAADYVRACFHPQTGGFTYQARGGSPGFARSCAAIYSLQVLGFYDDPMVKQGSNFVTERYGKDREWFTYGNFYGAPALYMIGGEAWERWYAMAKDTLLPKAKAQGDAYFWSPLEGGNGVNDVYATAVYATVLAMPYQYLPIYQR